MKKNNCNRFRVKTAILLIACFLLHASVCTAQSRQQRAPESDLDIDNPLALPSWAEVTKNDKSYTQVILRAEYGNEWDTAEVFITDIQPKQKTYTLTNWKYEDANESDLQGFDDPAIIRMAYRTRRLEGDRTDFKYNAAGMLQQKKDYDMLPQKTLSNLYLSFLEVAQGATEGDFDYGERGDEEEERSKSGYRRLFDSLAKSSLPERMIPTDSSWYEYNSTGNLLHRREADLKSDYRYHYKFDAAGRVVSKRIAYLSRANRSNYFSGHEFRYGYDDRSRLTSVAFYSWENDSSNAGKQNVPRMTEKIFYGAGGNKDSVHLTEGDRLTRHLYAYSDTLCTRYLRLQQNSKQLSDTLDFTSYIYEDGKLAEAVTYQSGMKNRSRTVYVNDRLGRTIEVERFGSDYSKGAERMNERHLFFYGDAQDAVTADRYKPLTRGQEIPDELLHPRLRKTRSEPAPSSQPSPVGAEQLIGDPNGIDPGIAAPPAVPVETQGVNQPVSLPNGSAQPNDDQVFIYVEQMPVFVGKKRKGPEDLQAYLRSNLRHPNNAVAGRVVVRFIVRANGSITDATIVHSLNPACDAEALRLIKAMPNWQPGKKDGKAVNVYFNLPILFPEPRHR